MIAFTLILTLLGLSLGSFLNVCIYRLPREISLFSRSFCPRCETNLRWFELIPIVSFVFQNGRCCTCREKIPWQYPIIEITSALIVVPSFLLFGPSHGFIIVATFLMLMLLVAVIDWQHLIIPNEIIIVGLATGIAIKFTLLPYELHDAFLGLCVAFVIMLGTRALGNWFFVKETMGFGDIKLAALIGFFLGIENFFVALWLSAFTGSIYGMVFMRQSNLSLILNFSWGTTPCVIERETSSAVLLKSALTDNGGSILSRPTVPFLPSLPRRPTGLPAEVLLARTQAGSEVQSCKLQGNGNTVLGERHLIASSQSAIHNSQSAIRQEQIGSKLPFGSFLAVTSSLVMVLTQAELLNVHSLIELWLTLLQ